MSVNLFRSGLVLSAVGIAAVAGADVMERPVGIRIGQRMCLKPYISFSAIYDSNVDNRKDGDDDVIWHVNPGLSLEYKAENWMLVANAYYQYNAYSKDHANSSSYNYHAFGEDVMYRWTDSTPGEPGWSLMLAESYKRLNNLEDMNTQSGSYCSDRDEAKLAAAFERRFSHGLHADVNTSYYWLKYHNDNEGAYGLYGWQRWLIGGELGWALSKWTDILLAGSYQGYKQDNTSSKYYSGDYGNFSNESDGYTLQAGIGSYATDRITYRVLGGISHFEYADGLATADGFSYTMTGNWKISDRWTTMLLATSYYQPNEHEYASATRVDLLSWGIAHTMVRGKLAATADLCYRRETHEYSATGAYDYDLDIMTFRAGLNYTINRYLALFVQAEYRRSISDGGSSGRGDYLDYDRFRGSLGVRFTY